MIPNTRPQLSGPAWMYLEVQWTGMGVLEARGAHDGYCSRVSCYTVDHAGIHLTVCREAALFQIFLHFFSILR